MEIQSAQKSIAITGSSSGLGLALTKELLNKREWAIYGIDLQDTQISHPSYRHLICDLADWSESQQKVPEFIGAKTPLSVLVNSAGIMPSSLVPSLDPVRAINAFAINAVAPVYMSKLLLKNLSRSREGHVINITSIAADILIPGEVIYSATKAALKAITESMASELARFNIRVNAVAPALIETKMTEHLSPSQIEFMKTKQAFSGSIISRHVADAIVSLIESPQQITSSTVYVGGIRK
jgi:3-oxoacyl-[acyl-carrier protein] reductase